MYAERQAVILYEGMPVALVNSPLRCGTKIQVTSLNTDVHECSISKEKKWHNYHVFFHAKKKTEYKHYSLNFCNNVEETPYSLIHAKRYRYSIHSKELNGKVWFRYELGTGLIQVTLPSGLTFKGGGFCCAPLYTQWEERFVSTSKKWYGEYIRRQATPLYPQLTDL